MALVHRVAATRRLFIGTAGFMVIGILSAVAYGRGRNLSGTAATVVGAILIIVLLIVLMMAIYLATSWLYLKSGRIGMVTLLTRREFPVEMADRAIRCSITSDTGPPDMALVLVDKDRHALLWLYPSVWGMDRLDELLRRIGVGLEGSWQDGVPWNEKSRRFPAAHK